MHTDNGFFFLEVVFDIKLQSVSFHIMVRIFGDNPQRFVNSKRIFKGQFLTLNKLVAGKYY